jgi:phosphatidate cytidylyltransferase
MKRVLTALVLAAVAIYSIFFAPPAVFTGVVAVMAAFCYYEYSAILMAHGVQGPLWLGYLMGLVVLADLPYARLLAGALLAFGLTVRELPKFLLFAGGISLGVLYVFAAWRCAIDLRAAGPHWLLFALSVNWVGDIAAFYVGRTFGKHKLAPRVSPGKSWEGAVGSMGAALLFGYAFFLWLRPAVPLVHLLLLSIVANAAGQVGDLAESALKRGAGIKDSSTLLPGHGGFLDRLDSSLFTMPVVYYYLILTVGHKPWSGSPDLPCHHSW